MAQDPLKIAQGLPGPGVNQQSGQALGSPVPPAPNQPFSGRGQGMPLTLLEGAELGGRKPRVPANQQPDPARTPLTIGRGPARAEIDAREDSGEPGLMSRFASWYGDRAKGMLGRAAAPTVLGAADTARSVRNMPEGAPVAEQAGRMLGGAAANTLTPQTSGDTRTTGLGGAAVDEAARAVAPTMTEFGRGFVGAEGDGRRLADAAGTGGETADIGFSLFGGSPGLQPRSRTSTGPGETTRTYGDTEITEYVGADGERAFTNLPRGERDSFVPQAGGGAIAPDRGLINAYNTAAQTYRSMTPPPRRQGGGLPGLQQRLARRVANIDSDSSIGDIRAAQGAGQLLRQLQGNAVDQQNAQTARMQTMADMQPDAPDPVQQQRLQLDQAKFQRDLVNDQINNRQWMMENQFDVVEEDDPDNPGMTRRTVFDRTMNAAFPDISTALAARRAEERIAAEEAEEAR